jgi:prephenate dehydratase
MKKVGIQGGPASYHEIAAKQMLEDIEIVYLETFQQLFQALHKGQVDSAVVAIANNRVQFIAEPYDKLTTPGHEFVVVGESYLKVKHALLGLKGVRLEDIKEVHSQAPALGQCMYFLEKHLPSALLVEEHDTAGSAKHIAELNDPSKAAIASEAAGKLYGLAVLKQAIQDDPANITRFLEIAKSKDAVIEGANKTTMLLKTPQVSGALVGALQPFKEHGINLSSLQSKLIPNTAFDMMFFIEFEAGINEERTQSVLGELHKNGYETDILGSYKRAPIPIN